MADFSIKIIYDKEKNKAKGVIMPKKQEEYIPEVIGLSKFQLFLFIFFAILLGTGACCMGVFFSNTKNQQEIQKKIQNKFIIDESNEKKEKNIYIIMGKFNQLEKAQNIVNKILEKTSQTCTITPKKGCTIVHLGPYSSESLATNEINLIYFKTGVKGSLCYEI